MMPAPDRKPYQLLSYTIAALPIIKISPEITVARDQYFVFYYYIIQHGLEKVKPKI